MVSHHDLTSIAGCDKSNLELKVSDTVFRDFLLMKVRSRSIAYATMKKKKKLSKIFRKLKERKARQKKTLRILKKKIDNWSCYVRKEWRVF